MRRFSVLVLLLTLMCVTCCVGSGSAMLRNIEGRYIVVLKDGINVDSVIDQIKERTTSSTERVNVFRKYHSALNGFAVEMSPVAAEMVSRMSEVKYIEADSIGNIDATSTSWGLDRIDQRDLPLDNDFEIQGEGEGVTVYVLDTGVHSTHSEFGGRVVLDDDFVGDGWKGIDCHGHGTHCAGTAAGGIHGIARKANIVSVRLFDCMGSGTLSGTLAGIDHVTATASHPAVMSMSFRFGAQESLDEAVARAVDSGIVAVAGAGNEDRDACSYSPGREPKAITVGATDRYDKRAWFSNYGSCVDIFAPGVDIISSSPASDDALATWSGTSMSTPHVAGAAAVLLGNGVPASDVMQHLLQDSSQNKIYNNNYNSPNKLLYLN